MIGKTAFAQPAGAAPPAPVSLSDLYSTIQAQEANFPIPQPSQTVQVATLDMSTETPSLSYAIPTYQGPPNFEVQARSPAPCEPATPPHGRQPNVVKGGLKALRLAAQNAPKAKKSSAQVMAASPPTMIPIAGSGPCLRVLQVPGTGGQLTVANALHLNIVFAIKNWPAKNLYPGLTMQLGSQTKTISAGATQVEFDDVTETSPALIITIANGLLINDTPVAALLPGVLPLQIKWQTVGAGAMTMPVLPVSIVYAPVVDPNKKNTNSAAKSQTTGNTTTVSLGVQSATTTPVPSTFQSTDDTASAMTAVGSVLSEVPVTYVKVIGTALTTIAKGLGSASATQTTNTGTTKQNSLSVSDTNTASETANASDGGPGQGDLITYYWNARVAWYSDGTKMQLAYLGSDGRVQISAAKLNAAVARLKSSPAGTIDPTAKADATSIGALLKLDPFVAGGPTATLDPKRFVAVSPILEMVSGNAGETYSHTITQTETTTATTTIVNAQTDKAGFLSFLGVGVTDNNTFQTTINQSTSAQDSVGETFTSNYSLFTDPSSYYCTQVYFDLVFGSFAFTDLTASCKTVAVSGSATPNQTVKATIADRSFVTAADANGQFKLRLPDLEPGDLTLTSPQSPDLHLKYSGTPLNDVKLNSN